MKILCKINLLRNSGTLFYEGAIEPVAIQMSQCFTNALFTDNERNFGNEITFEANRLQYASNATKVNVVKRISSYRGLNDRRR